MPRHAKGDYVKGMRLEGGHQPVLVGDPYEPVVYGRPPRPRPPPGLDAIRQRLDAVAAQIEALKRPR